METLLAALTLLAGWDTVIAIVIGTLVGVIVGVMPGLGSVVGITMVLPFTFTMPMIPSVALMLGVYCGSVYGGSISAIVINTPGTPQAAATALDGYPMAQRGEADRAIGWATLSSLIGGLFSVVVLMLFAPQLAAFALRFGPIEYFALAVFALTCIAAVSRGNMIKGLLAGCMGLFVAVVGVDPITGDPRFTFEIFALSAGINLIPAVVGLFALSEVFYRLSEKHKPFETVTKRVGFRLPGWAEWRPRLPTLLKGCIIGSLVGVLPGTGTATAAFISYSEAKRSGRFREGLGKGEPEGVVAAESSNNAVTGAALIPTLALGIPGDPVTAVMLGTLIIQGITPGARLFAEQIDLIYAIYIALILVNLCMFVIGAFGAQLFTRILRVPESLMLALIVVLSILGAIVVRGNPLDLVVMFAAGVAGFLLRYAGFPIAPLVIGMVLGPLVESSLRQGLIIKRGDFLAFFQHPIAAVFFLLTVLVLLLPIFSAVLKPRNNRLPG